MSEKGIMYFKSQSPEFVLKSITQCLKNFHYVPFSKIPKGYIKRGGEFEESFISKSCYNGWIVLLWEEYEELYKWAKNFSKIFKNAALLGFKQSSREGTSIKLYFNGELVLKIGEDSDEELFYYAPLPTEKSITKFLDILEIEELEKREELKKIIIDIREKRCNFSIAFFEKILKLPFIETSFREVQKQKTSENFDYILFVRDDSPLFLT